MKKVSTVAAKPSKKISQRKLTVGLDLGDRNSCGGSSGIRGRPFSPLTAFSAAVWGEISRVQVR